MLASSVYRLYSCAVKMFFSADLEIKYHNLTQKLNRRLGLSTEPAVLLVR